MKLCKIKNLKNFLLKKLSFFLKIKNILKKNKLEVTNLFNGKNIFKTNEIKHMIIDPKINCFDNWYVLGLKSFNKKIPKGEYKTVINIE